jgi:hypothetical protein
MVATRSSEGNQGRIGGFTAHCRIKTPRCDLCRREILVQT